MSCVDAGVGVSSLTPVAVSLQVLYAQAEGGRSRGSRWVDATKAALAILTILVAAALAETRVLHLRQTGARSDPGTDAIASPATAIGQSHGWRERATVPGWNRPSS
jgi:hypothetical protein